MGREHDDAGARFEDAVSSPVGQVSSRGGDRQTLLALGSVVGASVASRFLRVLKALVVARMLAPEDYGVLGALTIILMFAQFLDLGSAVAAFRDLASAVGRGATRAAAQAASQLATLKLASALLLGTGALAVCVTGEVSPRLRWGLLTLPAAAVSSSLLSQAFLQIQASGRTKELSYVTLLSAITDLALSVVLSWLWSLPGLLVAMALAPLVPLTRAMMTGALALPSRIPVGTLRRYLGTGLPLVALAFLDQSLLSVDQFIVLGFLSWRDMGLYNIAIVAPEAIRTLGTAAGAVLGPRLIREYARSRGELQAIELHTLLPVRVFASALPLPIAVFWIGGSYFLARFYPSYLQALRPMQVLLIGVGFLVVLGGVTTFLFAIDRHQRNLLFLTPAVCFNVILDLVLIGRGWGLTGVALGSLVTYFLYAFLVLWYVTGYFDLSLRERLVFQARAFLPGSYVALVLFSIERLWPYRDSLLSAVSALSLSVAMTSPLFLHALRLAPQLDERSAG